MHTEITLKLLNLTTEKDPQTGEPPLSRPQIAGFIGYSESYVDKRFQGLEDFKARDLDLIIQKAFDLGIKELIDRYLPDDQRIVHNEVAEYLIDGSLDDNMAAIIKALAKIDEIGEDCCETDELINKIHEQAETIRKELKAKSWVPS